MNILQKIVNIGITLGIPMLITLLYYFHSERISLLENQINNISAEKDKMQAVCHLQIQQANFLRYDEAEGIINAQKNLYNLEIQSLNTENTENINLLNKKIIKFQKQLKKYPENISTDLLKTLSAILDIIDNSKDIDNNSEFKDFIGKKLLENVFINTKYLTKNEYQDKINKIIGIGVQIQKENNNTVIMRIYNNTPAKKSGLAINDKIVAVNGVNTYDKTLNEIAKIMRGKNDTYLTLELNRNNSNKNMIIKLKRELIDTTSFLYKKIENNIHYISFNNITKDLYSKLIGKLEEINNSLSMNEQKLILDLRNNKGGFFQQIIDIVDIFMKKGHIISVKNKHNDEIEKYYAKPGDIGEHIKLVILTNSMTASGAEIIVKSLQKNNRATIIGTPTFGQINITVLSPLNQADFSIEEKIYDLLTDNNDSNGTSPIFPDILIQESNKTSVEDVYIQKSINFLNITQ